MVPPSCRLAHSPGPHLSVRARPPPPSPGLPALRPRTHAPRAWHPARAPRLALAALGRAPGEERIMAPAILDDITGEWVAAKIASSVGDAPRVELVEAEAVRQANSLVMPLQAAWGPEGRGSQERLILKVVDFAANEYRSELHLARTRASYDAELAFYRDAAPRIAAGGSAPQIPRLVHGESSEAGTVMVLGDLKSQAPPGAAAPGRQSLALTEAEARAALSWLARLHASTWCGGGGPAPPLGDGLWPEGGYWSLSKRTDDLAALPSEWAKTLAAFASDVEVGGAFHAPGVRDLGRRLQAAAGEVAEELKAAAAGGGAGWALLHGDFKAANLFFYPAGGEGKSIVAAACDFQWVGRGAGAVDVVYLLYSSLSPEALDRESDLVDFYHAELAGALAARGAAGPPPPGPEELRRQYEAAFIDYVRYLVGSAWGAVTPQTCEESADRLNLGIHRRSARHLAGMVARADTALAEWEARAYLSSPAPAAGGIPAPLVARLLAAAVQAGDQAGALIRTLLDERGGAAGLQQLEKGGFASEAIDDPQTLADVSAEALILGGLREAFPNVSFFGEEEIESDGGSAAHAGRIPPVPATLKLDAAAMAPVLAAAANMPAAVMAAGPGDITVWIDPLDGTKELLVNNTEGVTVLIGIAVGGEAVAGVVHQPFFQGPDGEMGRTLWGGAGIGVHGLSPPAPGGGGGAGWRVLSTRSHMSPAVQRAADGMAAAGPPGGEVIALGGAGSKAVRVLEGRAEAWVFPSNGTKRWDTCAPEALLAGAGGFLLNAATGARYDYSGVHHAPDIEGMPDSELLVLIISNGMAYGELAAVIEGLKNKSKSIGSHARRELYWQAYTKLSAKLSPMDGACYSLVQYWANGEEDGEVKLEELTKRQRGLVNGGCEFVGHKLKPPEDKDSKNWCMVYSEEEASKAWEDFMVAEPAIYVAADGVYVATRYKRALCKGLSAPCKTAKDVQAVVEGLLPDKPLKSISFVGNDPPACSGYNTFAVGGKIDGLPPNIGHVASTSTEDIYDYFLSRKTMHAVGEADRLISQMLTDVAKNQTPQVLTGKKEAQIAIKNALMKKVYVHESMGKFIDYVRNDGSVEIVVIGGKLEELGDFGKYGGLVFELFYRADLSVY